MQILTFKQLNFGFKWLKRAIFFHFPLKKNLTYEQIFTYSWQYKVDKGINVAVCISAFVLLD